MLAFFIFFCFVFYLVLFFGLFFFLALRHPITIRGSDRPLVGSSVRLFEHKDILNQSQVCISNGLEARVLQRESLICQNAFLHRDCETEMGNVFIQTNAISKQTRLDTRLPQSRAGGQGQ